MDITIDTSALIAVIINEPSKKKLIKLTESATLLAPSSVHWEIGNAFSAFFKRQAIDMNLAKQALAVYQSIPVKYIEVPLERALHITHEYKIYAYDAYLIQCAEQTSSPLLTLDKSLIRVAREMGLTLLEISDEAV